MEDNHLASFEVSHFKKFSHLSVENLGQFNLLVGDNNVGKTTLLEALLIDRDPNNFLQSLASIMQHIKKFGGLNDFFISQYFSDSESAYPRKLIFKAINKNLDTESFIFQETRPSEFRFGFGTNAIPDRNLAPFTPNKIQLHTPSYSFGIPYIPFASYYGDELTKQYSEHIQLFVDRKEKLIESLTQVIDNIKNIEVNASYSQNPILLISEKGKNKLSPLATYGDASIKLFRILLSLFANDYYNRLMIDEIEAGVHYSRLKDFLKSFFKIAKEQKKQIFASTHSKECIENFVLALKELGYENDGRIIRLAETKSGIKAYTNVYEQFENSLRADSEIR